MAASLRVSRSTKLFSGGDTFDFQKAEQLFAVFDEPLVDSLTVLVTEACENKSVRPDRQFLRRDGKICFGSRRLVASRVEFTQQVARVPVCNPVDLRP